MSSDHLPSLPKFTPDQFCFLPLGGCGEIGMNLNLYGYKGKWLMVDCGVTFHDERLPNVEVVLPDPAFIAAQKDNLVGLLVTHAHEDHLGAIPYLWPQLECPVYATGFAASVLRRKLSETSFGKKVPIEILPLSGTANIAPFEVQLITLTHSIPEPNGVVIRTPAGAVLHTGDWKIDPAPQVGDVTDEAALNQLGQEGLLACVCDSTNAMQQGHSGSEATVAENLITTFKNITTGRIAIGCFATNVARLHSIAMAAKEAGRVVSLAGRSLWRIYDAAKENGYLLDIPPFITPDLAAVLPPEQVCYICTGSQGEERAALGRIARGAYDDVVLEEGDTVVFSSRVIPGNEKSIFRLQNLLAKRGVKIITDRDAEIHVSGHPAQDELRQMYQWTRPRTAIPVHGEARHLQEHALLAASCQVPQSLIIENGYIVGLEGREATVLGTVPNGRLALHGTSLISTKSGVLKELSKTLEGGFVVVSLCIDEEGVLIDEPQLSTIGVLEEKPKRILLENLGDVLEAEISSLSRAQQQKDDAIIGIVKKTVRKLIQTACGKRPIVEVHLYRLEEEIVE